MISGCSGRVAMPKRRMAIVTSIGGTLRFFSGLGDKLLERGWTTWAIADRDNHYDDVCRIERFHPCPIKLRRRIDPFGDLLAVFRLWWTFRQKNLACVHAHTPKAGLTSMTAAWLARVPIRTYTVHGLPIETSNGIRRVLLWLADSVAFLCATNVYCVSPSVKVQLGRYRLPKAKSARVLGPGTICGVDVDGRFHYCHSAACITRNAARAELGIPKNAVVAGFVGRFVYDKGIRELVEAWNLALKAVPGLRMLMVGALDYDGGGADEIIATVQGHPNWYWTGWQPAVEKYVPAMDFLVLPSYREGFPTVVLEAGALQTPSIVTDATGCIDSVVHGCTGQIIPTRDSAALATAIIRYANDIQLRQIHGKNARDHVISNFSRAAVQAAFLDEYDRLHEQFVNTQQWKTTTQKCSHDTSKRSSASHTKAA